MLLRLGRVLVEQAVTSSQPVGAELALKMRDTRGIRRRVFRRRELLEPDRILAESAQTEHPLQRDREIAASLPVFGGKAASKENGHEPENRSVRQRGKCRPTVQSAATTRKEK